MKTDNINAMLYFLEKSGISLEFITSGHYKDNSIILKRQINTKNTYTLNTISVKIDTKENMVVIKDENMYEYINLKNNKESYIYNLQTIITYVVNNNKLNVKTVSATQKVTDKKDIINFNKVKDFYDKSTKIIDNEISYDVPDNYKITDKLPEDKEKILKKVDKN